MPDPPAPDRPIQDQLTQDQLTRDLVIRPDIWAEVIGQPTAVAGLQAGAPTPVHAYLFLGPRGSGRHAAARAFAAAVLGVDALLRGDDVERHVQLALADRHPDVHLFAPEGANLRVEEATEIARLASRSPIESGRKLLVLDEFHKVQQAGPALLKTIEEPSASTVFVILAEEIPDELVPIASRALRIDFGSVPIAAVERALVDAGVAPEVAAQAAAAAGGDLDRARLLATDPALAARRESWRSVAGRVDGTGHLAAAVVDELVAQIDLAQAPLDERHAGERTEMEERIEAFGLRKSELKDLDERHKRIVRRSRQAELRHGLGVLAGAYRDQLATAPDPRPARDALRAIQDAAEALTRNPNEVLLLQALVAGLPPAG